MTRLSPRLARFACEFAVAAGLPTANYAHHAQPKKSQLAHFPIPSERKTALDIIRWCYAVAGIAADSPRFPYYVSRWDVPCKVARAIAADTFDQITANCPPVDADWIRFAPAALEAHREFTAKHAKPTAKRAPRVSGFSK